MVVTLESVIWSINTNYLATRLLLHIMIAKVEFNWLIMVQKLIRSISNLHLIVSTSC